MNRASIIALLERHSHIVDDDEEREELATAIHNAMLKDPHAQFIRVVFTGCTSGGRVIKASANGKFLGAVLDAAWALAGGE